MEAFKTDIAFFEWIPEEFKNEEMKNILQLNITKLQEEIKKQNERNPGSQLHYELKRLEYFISFFNSVENKNII